MEFFTRICTLTWHYMHFPIIGTSTKSMSMKLFLSDAYSQVLSLVSLFKFSQLAITFLKVAKNMCFFGLWVAKSPPSPLQTQKITECVYWVIACSPKKTKDA
jgi:hypothetical protein